MLQNVDKTLSPITQPHCPPNTCIRASTYMIRHHTWPRLNPLLTHVHTCTHTHTHSSILIWETDNIYTDTRINIHEGDRQQRPGIHTYMAVHIHGCAWLYTHIHGYRYTVHKHTHGCAGLFERAGMQAQVPTVSFRKSPSALNAVPNSTVEAIACLGGITDCDPVQQKQLLTEAVRVLRPGAPFIFIEPVADGASPLRPIITNSSNTGKALSELPT